MSHPRPDRNEILDSLASWLDRRIKPAVAGELGFETRIAIAMLRTLSRELASGDVVARLDADALATLVPDAEPSDREAELCRRIRDGRIAADEPTLVAYLRETTVAAISVDSPRYPSFAVVREVGFPPAR